MRINEGLWRERGAGTWEGFVDNTTHKLQAHAQSTALTVDGKVERDGREEKRAVVPKPRALSA